MTSTRLFIVGLTGVALAGCGNLFQRDEPRASTGSSQPPAQAAVPQAEASKPAAQAGTPGAEARPVTHELVRKVQEELKAEGIDPGPIDGRWGPQTAQAVQQFQETQGLETTARLDEATLAALGIAGGQSTLEVAPLSRAEAAAARAATGSTGQAVQLQRSALGTGAPEKQTAQPRFANLDADDDGTITLAEAAADTRVSRNFERADRNNDHRLSREEFQAALQVDRQGPQSPFAAADRNSDGMLNREEYQEALRTRQAREEEESAAAGASRSR